MADLDRSGWTAYATSTRVPAEAPSKALDGDILTFWRDDMAGIFPLYFWVDLGSAQTFDSLTVRGYSVYGPGSIEVRVSDDGSSWGSAVASATWGSAGPNTVTFSSVTKRYAQLKIINDYPGVGWTCIAEFNLGSSGPPPADPSQPVLMIIC